ncbi:MAG: hypothetical protein EHM64_02950 [Ignavibacteriae bacterium]|nr:MAG: hypothetical protein EHM64_02950 [Ignavibacteriota bacterium]
MMQTSLAILLTLLGVFIGAFISTFVAGLQFRADIISKYRQEWIRELRDIIADYQSIVGRLELLKFSRAEGETQKDVHDIIERLVLSMNKIALMLDLTDSQQNKLHSLMIQIRQIFEEIQNRDQMDAIISLTNQINDVSRTIFMAEFNKAVKGK